MVWTESFYWHLTVPAIQVGKHFLSKGKDFGLQIDHKFSLKAMMKMNLFLWSKRQCGWRTNSNIKLCTLINAFWFRSQAGHWLFAQKWRLPRWYPKTSEPMQGRHFHLMFTFLLDPQIIKIRNIQGKYYHSEAKCRLQIIWLQRSSSWHFLNCRLCGQKMTRPCHLDGKVVSQK